LLPFGQLRTGVAPLLAVTEYQDHLVGVVEHHRQALMLYGKSATCRDVWMTPKVAMTGAKDRLSALLVLYEEVMM
jgi:hypothetical protein